MNFFLFNWLLQKRLENQLGNLPNGLHHLKMAHDIIIMRFPGILFMRLRQKAVTSSALMYFNEIPHPSKKDNSVHPILLVSNVLV